MSTKKIDRSEQSKSISEQMKNAMQAVTNVTSQQEAPKQVEENTEVENNRVEEKLFPVENESSETQEKKVLRGAASPKYKRAKKEKVLIAARIDKQMEDEINSICEKENMSKSDILTFALDYVLSSYKMRKLVLGRNSFIENVIR